MKTYVTSILACSLSILSSWAYACDLTESHSQLHACIQKAYQGPVSTWPAPTIDAGVQWQELSALPDIAPAPQNNPVTEAKIQLGKQLFFDPLLSRNQDVACASCHQPELGFSDGASVSTGHMQRTGRRNSPSIVMSGFTHKPFWDGRTTSLEEQSLKPIEDPVEMGFSIDQLVLRLQTSMTYKTQFAAAFAAPISAQTIAQALASYQRSVLPHATAFEQFMRGNREALNAKQLHGLHIFRTKGRCMNCHNGVALSDDQFHNLGLTYYGRQYEDLGRYEVTENAADVGRFRTPSLRLVGQTGPWMHNGLFPHLWGVINMYNAGMPQNKPRADQLDDPLFPITSPLIKPLGLTELERENLEAFLRSL